MNPAQTPRSPPSSPGSGNLEIEVARSARLLLFAAAWSLAALLGIQDCQACGTGLRLSLVGLLAAALGSAVPPLVPGWGPGAVLALALDAAGWRIRIADRECPVAVEVAIEVLRSGWWLQLRCLATGRRHWAWIDAGRTPCRPYRSLCRALRRRRSRGAQHPVCGSAGRSTDTRT